MSNMNYLSRYQNKGYQNGILYKSFYNNMSHSYPGTRAPSDIGFYAHPGKWVIAISGVTYFLYSLVREEFCLKHNSDITKYISTISDIDSKYLAIDEYHATILTASLLDARMIYNLFENKNNSVIKKFIYNNQNIIRNKHTIDFWYGFHCNDNLSDEVLKHCLIYIPADPNDIIKWKLSQESYSTVRYLLSKNYITQKCNMNELLIKCCKYGDLENAKFIFENFNNSDDLNINHNINEAYYYAVENKNIDMKNWIEKISKESIDIPMCLLAHKKIYA